MRFFFEQRTLASCTLAFAAGAAAARLAGVAGIAAAAALLALCFVKTKNGPVIKRALLVCGAVSMLLGVARYSLAEAVKPAAPSQKDGLLEGNLADDAYLSGGGTLNIILENTKFDGTTVGGRVLCKVYQDGAGYAADLPEYGAAVRVSARLRLPRGTRNPGGYDEALTLSSKNIAFVASGSWETLAVNPIRALSPYATLLRFRGAMKRFMDASLSDRQASLLSAMLFGDKSLLEEAVHEDFRTSGAAHVLAVSGLHVMALAGALAWLMKKARVLIGAAAVICTALLFMYCVLAAFSASVVRASIMAAVVLFAPVCGRRQDTFTSLSAAAFVILLVNPYQLFMAGFQLSFSAVLGILALQTPLRKVCIFIFTLPALFNKTRRKKRWRRVPKAVRWLISALSTSVSATLGTLPAMLACYQSVAPIGIVTNLAAVPLAGLIVVAGLPFAAFGALVPGVFAPFAPILGFALDLMAWLARVFSLEGGMLYLPPAPLAASCAFLFAAFYCKISIKKPMRAFAAAICAVSALALGVGYRLISPPGTQVVMLDVGQGDSFVIRSGGKAMLIDAGSSRTMDYGEAVVLPALRAMGILRLDAALLTHADDDHMGGFASVLNSMKIDNFIGNVIDDKSAPVQAALRKAGTRAIAPKPGDTLALGDARLTILRAVDAATTNEASIVALLTYEGASILFTGDLDGASEPQIASVGEITALKAAHHGSRNSTTAEFLSKAAPKLALISVGGNSYGHPSEEVLARLQAIGAVILRTDLSGAVFISFAGGRVEARTMVRND